MRGEPGAASKSHVAVSAGAGGGWGWGPVAVCPSSSRFTQTSVLAVAIRSQLPHAYCATDEAYGVSLTALLFSSTHVFWDGTGVFRSWVAEIRHQRPRKTCFPIPLMPQNQYVALINLRRIWWAGEKFFPCWVFSRPTLACLSCTLRGYGYVYRKSLCSHPTVRHQLWVPGASLQGLSLIRNCDKKYHS